MNCYNDIMKKLSFFGSHVIFILRWQRYLYFITPIYIYMYIYIGMCLNIYNYRNIV